MSNTIKLSLSTKAKREAIAKRTAELVSTYPGASCEWRQSTLDPKSIGVVISFGPYRASLDLRGNSSVGTFLVHWYTGTFSRMTYPKNFGSIIGGTVNEYHYGKATSFANSVDALLQSIDDGLCAISKFPMEA